MQLQLMKFSQTDPQNATAQHYIYTTHFKSKWLAFSDQSYLMTGTQMCILRYQITYVN